MADRIEEITYESALQELENILQELETPQMELDDLHGKVAKARELLLFCRAKLRDVTQELTTVQAAVTQNQNHAE